MLQATWWMQVQYWLFFHLCFGLHQPPEGNMWLLRGWTLRVANQCPCIWLVSLKTAVWWSHCDVHFTDALIRQNNPNPRSTYETLLQVSAPVCSLVIDLLLTTILRCFRASSVKISFIILILFLLSLQQEKNLEKKGTASCFDAEVSPRSRSFARITCDFKRDRELSGHMVSLGRCTQSWRVLDAGGWCWWWRGCDEL